MTSRILALITMASCLIAPNFSWAEPIYDIPLRFDPVGDGVQILPLELEYDLSDPLNLRIANLNLSLRNFYAMIVEGKKLDQNLVPLLSAKESGTRYFVFSWPERLLPEGRFEMIGRSGEVLWQFDLNEKSKAKWSEKLNSYQKRMINAKVPTEKVTSSPFLNIPYGVEIDLKSDGNPIAKQVLPYRFCISNYSDAGYSRLCSAYYETIRSGKQVRMDISPKSTQPQRVFVYNEKAELKASIPVSEDRSVQFFAELGVGMSYEFVGTPEKIHLLEMMAGNNSQEAIVRGWGGRPLQPSRILNPDGDSYLTELIGWQATIGDLRKFWETTMDRDSATIYLPGRGGGCFKQKFIITKLPTEHLRPYIEKRSVSSSYVDNVKVFGRKQNKVSVTTTQNSLEREDDRDFVWYFRADKRGELNRSYLQVQDGKEDFRTYYEIFKGYPREMSLRGSAILSSRGQMVLVGEASFQYWLEDIFGWSNYYVSRQRWGMSAKYFQTLAPFLLGQISDTLRTTTFDLKYRLEPGLWERDETWGLILGYQKVQYSTFNSGMIGAGLFWARSMPRVFDDLMNEFKFFKYPKWVDMEFIYYASSTEANTRVKIPTYALNFHGKIIWSKHIFGEAGFGIKQYNIDDKKAQLNMTFASLYGTAGIGINF